MTLISERWLASLTALLNDLHADAKAEKLGLDTFPEEAGFSLRNGGTCRGVKMLFNASLLGSYLLQPVQPDRNLRAPFWVTLKGLESGVPPDK